MSPSILRFIVTTLLLAALLAPETLPGGHRCACGMTVGCCCQLKAAMKAGDHCALRRPARPCGMRTGTEDGASLQPRGREGWIGPDFRTGPRPVLTALGIAHISGEPLPASLASDPPTPPPRLVRMV